MILRHRIKVQIQLASLPVSLTLFYSAVQWWAEGLHLDLVGLSITGIVALILPSANIVDNTERTPKYLSF